MIKIQYKPIGPTPAALAAGRRPLTPQLMAAVDARVSRNNEGLEAILGMVDFSDPEGSIDRIMRMADYGHASIKDLTTTQSISLDGLTLWEIYEIFTLTPTGSGQETSTRYVDFGNNGAPTAAELGLPEEFWPDYELMLPEAAALYRELTTFWTKVATDNPAVMGIPQRLLDDAAAGGVLAVKTVDRLRRNYVFDRARYVIPMAMRNNMSMQLTARGWGDLTTTLLSHPRDQARAVGLALIPELTLFMDKLMRRVQHDEDRARTLAVELRAHALEAGRATDSINQDDDAEDVHVDLYPPNSLTPSEWSEHELFSSQFEGHVTRYHPVGSVIGRCGIRYCIHNLAIAELRDLNRHRPGHKFHHMHPVGVYYAADQVPPAYYKEVAGLFERVRKHLIHNTEIGRDLLRAGDPCFPYFYQLGTQLRFEHFTTLDKFIYTAELRTGPGVHYRYGAQMRAVLHAVYKQIPELRGKVLEGSAEPE